MAQDTRRRRVGAELHRLLNELLRTEVKDPRLEDVTVSEVEMSGDLGVARIYYATLDPDASADEAQAGFRNAGGFLRGRIGHALRLRRAPELHFVRDESARRGAELTRLIENLNAPASDDPQASDDPPASDDPQASDDNSSRDDGEGPDEAARRRDSDEP